MSRQQQWEIDEAVVLLDGLLEIISSNSSRNDTIKRVSSVLRRRAVNCGYEIDNVFRNENGIAFQLASMESAYYGKTKVKPATKLFVQTVEMYRSNKAEYENLLKGALDMANGIVENHEEQFMNWLSTQVSPMQLSELYESYRDIEKFCLKVNIIDTPLFSSIDFNRAKKVKSTIEANKVYRFTHKRNIAKHIAAVAHFARYCKSFTDTESKGCTSGKVQKEEAPESEQDAVLAQKYPIIYKRIKAIVCGTSDILTALDIKQQVGTIARLADVEYIIANASWGYDTSEQKEIPSVPSQETSLYRPTTYFSPLKIKNIKDVENSGEAIKNWNDVILISEQLISKNKFKENLLFVILVNTGLTVDTVLTLKFSDFLNSDKSFKEYFSINKNKTAANSRDESGEYHINKDIFAALYLYSQEKPGYNLGDYLFVGESNRNSSTEPFTLKTALRVFSGITQDINGKYNISARTLKKTYDYHFGSLGSDAPDEDAKSEPIKQLSDIIKISSLLAKGSRYRDRLLFAVGVGLGMTCRELMKLRFEHIINEDGSIKKVLPAFGNFDDSECELYIDTSEEICNAIDQYRKCCGINDLNDFVFKSESNRKTDYALASKSILRLIKEVVSEANVNVNATTLTFKKTFLYHQLLMSGGNAQMKAVVRKALKHSSFAQTMDFLCAKETEFDVTSSEMPVISMDQHKNTDPQTTYSVDFSAIGDYAYSSPKSFTYFDQEYQDLRSWTDLYVKLFTCLYEDYPHILKPGMSFSRTSGGRIELATEAQQSMMYAPKKIKNTDLVLETNISASNMISKIRFWLEICNVDFENIKIIYSKKSSASVSRGNTERQQLTESPIQTIVADEKYKKILQEHFKKGFRLESGLDLKKFKRFYIETYGVELSDDDNTIGMKIRNCGVIHEEKLFIPEVMLSDELREKLFTYISDEFSQGKKTIYYEALFRTFSEQFLDYYIYDSEMLKSFLAHYNNGKYHIASNYLANEDVVSANPYDEVKDYLIGAGIPVDASVICEVLSHIPSKKIMQILGMNAEFVHNGKSHYFHVSAVNLSKEELDNIAVLISEMIAEKEFISGNELVSAIKAKYPYIIDNNQHFSMLGMRDAIKFKLQNRFSFSGNVISGKEKKMSMTDVFANFAKGRASFDIAELDTLAEEMNSVIYFDAVYENSLRISQSQFVSKEQAQFQVHALQGAWNQPNYWEEHPNLLISRIKIKVDSVIKEAFEIGNRISIKAIYDVLRTAPYGFMPCNLTAFVLGFLLKEYANGAYSWSDGLTNDLLDVNKLKEMVAEIITQQMTPNARYKDKYIVAMTNEEKAFNEATAIAFNIPKNLCTSVEQTRERIRNKMKEYSFPIWVLKSILDKYPAQTNCEVLKELIDCYCGIANSNNMGGSKTDSDIAMSIGRICIANQSAAEELKSLLSKEKCTEGMQTYLATYQDGILPELSMQVGDNGQYINVLRRKFDADAANWVWNVDTAQQKIQEVVLEYKIIAESNKYVDKTLSFDSAIAEWCDKCQYIRISYAAAKNYLDELGPFLEILHSIKKSGQLLDSQKQKFLDLLTTSGSAFIAFRNNQIDLFKRVCSYYLDGYSEDEIRELYQTIPAGTFTYEKSDYINLVDQKSQAYRSNLGNERLKKMWRDKTGTASPREWSKKHRMPILCLIADEEMQKAKSAFGTINKAHPDATAIDKAIQYLENASFFDKLNDEEYLDRVFRECIIKGYAVMLTDVNEVKDYLDSHITADGVF